MCNIGVYLRGLNDKKTYLLMDFEDPKKSILDAARRCMDAEDSNRRKPKSKKMEKHRNQLE